MILVGNCLDVLRRLADEGVQVDAVCTDPPYGIGFMGSKWDHAVPGPEYWAAVLEVLKPGGHLLAFAGTRTQHRMCCNIEDAGFEIRDMLAWIYGSGFPKNHDISKAIDKAAGAKREVIGKSSRHGGGKMQGKSFQISPKIPDITAPATPDAQTWAGWGTALKPALEPITLARKPFRGTIANNVLEHGTGAINISGCRVEGNRWPANLIHDGSDEVLQVFPDENHRFFYCAKPTRAERDAGLTGKVYHGSEITGRKVGSAGAKNSKYAGTSETPRRNPHPTVKPVHLMRYLCRLITPPGGVVLDPFLGSGTTGIAAALEGFDFMGIELNPAFAEVAKQRIRYFVDRLERDKKGIPEPMEIDGLPQLNLF